MTDPKTRKRTEEYAANARLIAKAPELFEALCYLHGEFMSRMDLVRDRDWTPDEIKAEAQAREAMQGILYP